MFWRFEFNRSVLFVLGFAFVFATNAFAQGSQQNLAQDLDSQAASYTAIEKEKCFAVRDENADFPARQHIVIVVGPRLAEVCGKGITRFQRMRC